VEYLPPGYGDGAARPLLVFLHGGGEGGDGTETSLRQVTKLGIPMMIAGDEWPEDRPFVVLTPQFSRADVQDCELADELDSFLDFALTHYDVDERRVYLTGLSCGAIGVWDYVAVHGNEVVTAVVPIAGHAANAIDTAGCELGQVPVWAFHGADDEVVPVMYIEDPIEELKACDPPPTDVRLTIYPDADHFENDAWTRTYDLSAGHDVYAWLLSHERL
jgi:predicted peptidase